MNTVAVGASLRGRELAGILGEKAGVTSLDVR
jgi:hypothetical protein